MAVQTPDHRFKMAVSVMAPLDLVYVFFRDRQAEFFNPQDALDLIVERPGASLSWRSAGDGGSGTAEFSVLPGDHGTMVAVQARIRKSQVAGFEKSLRRLRALLEDGEVPTVAGQPRGGSA